MKTDRSFNRIFPVPARITVLFLVSVCVLMTSCDQKQSGEQMDLFSRENLVAWCIVPYDNQNRTPLERADMLNELGLSHFAYDWRPEHLPSFSEEIHVMREHHVEIYAVWFWISGEGKGLLDANNQVILKILDENQVQTRLWVSFSDMFFNGLSDSEMFKKAKDAVEQLYKRADEIGCTIALYNHGGWFGDPVNQIRIIQELEKDIGIVYNFHHAHAQIDKFPQLLNAMLPYLETVNINGMSKDGPKILTVGQGENELEMLKALASSGYQGAIGILGHVKDGDVKDVLEENLTGLDSLAALIN